MSDRDRGRDRYSYDTDFIATIREGTESAEFISVLGTDRVPIISPVPSQAALEGVVQDVLFLDTERLFENQWGRLLDHYQRRSGVPRAEVERDITRYGLPIRLSSISVTTYSPLRGFDGKGGQVNDQEFEQAYAREFSARAEQQVVLDMDFKRVMVMIGALQLAMRHPAFPETSYQILDDTLRSLVTAVAPDETSALRSVLERGFDPTYDQP